jgi:hypothetical protein
VSGGRVTTFVDRSIQQTVLAALGVGTVLSRGLARNDVTVFLRSASHCVEYCTC